MTGEQLAKMFHETYEKLAPQHGYETRKESAVQWKDVPDNNKSLMIATCTEILKELNSTEDISKRPLAQLLAINVFLDELFELPNWENRIGPWTDIQKTIKNLYIVHTRQKE